MRFLPVIVLISIDEVEQPMDQQACFQVVCSMLIVYASVGSVKGEISWRKKPILLKNLNMLTTDPKRDDLRASVIDRFGARPRKEVPRRKRECQEAGLRP
jgi:hypothetical protein